MYTLLYLVIIILICYTGEIEFDLHTEVPKLAKSASRCHGDLNHLNGGGTNLFQRKYMHGWLPVYKKGSQIGSRDSGQSETTVPKLTVSLVMHYIVHEFTQILQPAKYIFTDMIPLSCHDICTCIYIIIVKIRWFSGSIHKQ